MDLHECPVELQLFPGNCLKWSEIRSVCRVIDFSGGGARTGTMAFMKRWPPTIAHLYRSWWRVELFFRRIKQHLRIKAFYGHSENAVRT